jgi:hypothetical protein
MTGLKVQRARSQRGIFCVSCRERQSLGTIVALARRLAVIMHRIWVDGTEFRWTREAVAT